MFNMLKLPFTGDVADMGDNKQLRIGDHQFESPERAVILANTAALVNVPAPARFAPRCAPV